MKIIKINSCNECPYNGVCTAWKKLTAEQRFKLTCGVGVQPFILKGCILEDDQFNKTQAKQST